MRSSRGEWRAWNHVSEVPGETPSRGFQVLRKLGAAAWFLTLCGLWFDVTRDDFAAALGSVASSRAVTGAALAAVAARVGSQLIETGFYTLAWRFLARPIRFWRMFAAVVSLSILDAIASVLVRLAGPDSHAAWLALLVGVRVLPEVWSAESGLRLAFGGVGALTVLRVMGTVYAQRREGPPWRGALALTFALWFAGRLTTWWSADLVRGMSPLP